MEQNNYSEFSFHSSHDAWNGPLLKTEANKWSTKTRKMNINTLQQIASTNHYCAFQKKPICVRSFILQYILKYFLVLRYLSTDIKVQIFIWLSNLQNFDVRISLSLFMIKTIQCLEFTSSIFLWSLYYGTIMPL